MNGNIKSLLNSGFLLKRSKLLPYKIGIINDIRNFKNFGHKRQYTPLPTMIWHGFLTFTFIVMIVEWKRMATFFFGSDEKVMNPLQIGVKVD